MLNTTNIIIVAPERYMQQARKLSHEISKVPGCNGTFWTIKHYEDNEFQLSGKQYAILIGNPAENRLTADFLPIMKVLNNQAGACFGYDGPKAVIFGEGKLEQEKEFKEVRKKTKALVAAVNPVSGIAVSIIPIIGSPFWWITGPVGIAEYFLARHYDQKKRERILREEQAKVALTLFFAEYFEAWVGLKQ